MAVPTPRDAGSVAGRAVEPAETTPPAPTLFGPTGVHPAGLPALSANRLDVTITPGETTTVRVLGELLQETAPGFSDAVTDLGDDPAVTQLILDLRGTTFMDSTGLGSLVNLRNQVLVRGGRFQLVRPQDRVFRLFELTRLDTVFEFVDAD